MQQITEMCLYRGSALAGLRFPWAEFSTPPGDPAGSAAQLRSREGGGRRDRAQGK